MRTSESITQNEINAYAKFCDGRGVIHDGSQDDQHNANFVLDYFVNTWKQDITEKNLETAWDEIRPHLKLYSSAYLECSKVANLEPERASALSTWLATQGKVGQLVGQGDEAFENLRLLLLTLRGYQIDGTTISHAIDRIQSKPGPKLHFVQAARRTEPKSPAALADDGQPFLGRNLNEPEWVKRSRERSEREAKEAASQQSAASAQSAAVPEAQRKAEGLAGGSHSETSQLQRILVTKPGTSEIDWIQTVAERQRMQKQFQKHRETNRFIR